MSYHNHKMRDSRGYTVVELLAVVTILVLITGVVAALITQTLRGTSRTKITNQVAQAGSYVTSVISASVISAENIVSINGQEIVDCTGNPSGQSIEIFMSEERGVIEYACMDDTIASGSVSLIDTNSLRIDTTNQNACYFRCSQPPDDPYSPPFIEFGFTITQKNENVLFENRESAPFQTSALMRNYHPN